MGNIKDAIQGVDTGSQVGRHRVPTSQTINDQVRAEREAADQVTAAVERFARQQKWVLVLDQPASVGLMKRMQRAQELVPHHVVNVGCGHYQVASATQQGIYYNVRLDAGCTCPDSMRQDGAPYGWCKHRLAAWLYGQYLRDQGCQLLDQDQDPLDELVDRLTRQVAELDRMVQELQAALTERNGSQPRS